MPDPRGGDKAHTRVSGLAWLAGLPRSPRFGVCNHVALSLCPLEASHPGVREGLQQPITQGSPFPFRPRRHLAQAPGLGDAHVLWASLPLLPEARRRGCSQHRTPSCLPKTL